MHICDLVWVGNHRSSARGEDGIRKLRWDAEAALDMHVTINEAGCYIIARTVHALPGSRDPCLRGHTCDAATRYGYLGLIYLARLHIHKTPAPKQQVSFSVAPCHSEEIVQLIRRLFERED